LSNFSPDVIIGNKLNGTVLQFHHFQDCANFSVSLGPGLPRRGLGGGYSRRSDAQNGETHPGPNLRGAAAWAALAQTAIASGSFLFAFAPRELRRWSDAQWLDRYFQNGGTHDNDPIGQTINVPHDIDWDSTQSPAHLVLDAANIQRIYLFRRENPKMAMETGFWLKMAVSSSFMARTTP
jgi:hypothetical protein